jgi:hypothetical protein
VWLADAPCRIFAFTEPTDMRKSFQGLLALVQHVFRDRDRDRDPYSQIAPRLEAMELAAGQQRHERRVDLSAVVAPDEEPRLATHGLAAKRELRVRISIHREHQFRCKVTSDFERL